MALARRRICRKNSREQTLSVPVGGAILPRTPFNDAKGAMPICKGGREAPATMDRGGAGRALPGVAPRAGHPGGQLYAAAATPVCE